MRNLQPFGKDYKPHLWKTKPIKGEPAIWCCTGGQNFRNVNCIAYTVTFGETAKDAYDWFMSGDTKRHRTARQMIKELKFRDVIAKDRHHYSILKSRPA